MDLQTQISLGTDGNLRFRAMDGTATVVLQDGARLHSRSATVEEIEAIGYAAIAFAKRFRAEMKEESTDGR